MGVIVLILGISAGFGVLGYWYSRNSIGNVQEYIVVRNSIGSGLSIATFVATGIGAWILFAPTETAINFGLVALIGYAIGGASPLIAFWFLGPRLRYLMPNGNRLAEYVSKRFGGKAKVLILAVMVFYMFVFLTAELTAVGQTVRLIAPDISMILIVSIVGLVTTAYTSYGGLRASIFTDGIQFLIILPLLIVLFLATVYALGGPSDIINEVRVNAPDKLDLGNTTGIATAVSLIIAVLAANLFHQGYWQRIFSAVDDESLKKSLTISSIIVIPIVLIAGSFGLIALSDTEAFAGIPAIAMFEIVGSELPDLVGILIILLVIALVMSSMDTLLNGIASLLIYEISDMSRSDQVLTTSRTITFLLLIPAIIIASREFSVLYMFFIADLVAAGFIYPVFRGMYSKLTKGWMVISSGFLGILVSLIFFPKSDWSGAVLQVSSLNTSPSLMNSFLSCLLISVCTILVLEYIGKRYSTSADYDFEDLRE